MIGRDIELWVPPGPAREHTDFERATPGQAFRTLRDHSIHKDRRLFRVSITISSITDKTGTVSARESVIARDITERKQAEALISHLAAMWRS